MSQMSRDANQAVVGSVLFVLALLMVWSHELWQGLESAVVSVTAAKVTPEPIPSVSAPFPMSVPAPAQSAVSLSAIPDSLLLQPGDVLSFAGQPLPINRPEVREGLLEALRFYASNQAGLRQAYGRGKRYLQLVQDITAQRGQPADLWYLALHESESDPRALSPKGAGGLWQLMPETAREFGLRVDDVVDERFDVRKASFGACYFIASYHATMGFNWFATLAIYNIGLGKHQTLQQEQPDTDVFTLKSGPENTRFVYRVVAVKHLYQYRERWPQLVPEESEPPLALNRHRLVKLTQATAQSELARDLGLTQVEFRERNPHLLVPVLPPGIYTIYQQDGPLDPPLVRYDPPF